MKKGISVALALACLLMHLPVCVWAADEALSTSVTVTIADKGTLAVSAETVTVTDSDQDGLLTISDALYAAHEQAFDGGATVGYATQVSDYGLSLGTLWGDDSGNFGYYVNHASAQSLADPVKNGDHVAAFVYADFENWSDTYCFFDVDTASVAVGEDVNLTLLCAGYDANRNPVTLPVAGAVITLDGTKTDRVTDANGKVTLTSSETGEYLVSAVSETMTLVPPVCEWTVTAATTVSASASQNKTDSPKTAESSDAVWPMCLIVGVVIVCVAVKKIRLSHETI